MTATIGALTMAQQQATDTDRLRQESHQLEGVFLNTLMKEMFGSIKTDDKDFGGGFAEQTWRGMEAEQMAGAVADAGGIGLADSILRQLLSTQEASQSPQPTSPR